MWYFVSNELDIQDIQITVKSALNIENARKTGVALYKAVQLVCVN